LSGSARGTVVVAVVNGERTSFSDCRKSKPRSPPLQAVFPVILKMTLKSGTLGETERLKGDHTAAEEGREQSVRFAEMMMTMATFFGFAGAGARERATLLEAHASALTSRLHLCLG
jgi:hypothetical protein